MESRFDWGERLPALGAKRVGLRWLEPSDVPALFEVFSDPEVMRYWSSTPLVDQAAAAGLLRHIHDRFAARTLFQWGIARRADGRVIGTCTLFHLDAENRRAEIGFALGRAHWGQGLASEALGLLIGFAFGTLGLHRLEAGGPPAGALPRGRRGPGLRLPGAPAARVAGRGDGTRHPTCSGLGAWKSCRRSPFAAPCSSPSWP